MCWLVIQCSTSAFDVWYYWLAKQEVNQEVISPYLTCIRYWDLQDTALIVLYIQAITTFKYKQKAPCIFCQSIHSHGCYSLNEDTPSTPNLEAINSHHVANFIKIGHIYLINLIKNNKKSRMILSVKNNTTWWRQWSWKLHGKWIRSCYSIRWIGSFKLNNGHVTH